MGDDAVTIKAEPDAVESALIDDEEEATIVAMKAGQKKPTPTNGDADRVFYESLYKQTDGESHMAQKWCVEYGIFEEKKAKEIYKLVAARGNKASSPVPQPVKKKAKIIDDTGGDVGIAGESSSNWESR